MHVIADICLIPIGVGVSLTRHVQLAYDVFAAAGLGAQLHPYGTVVEGEYDDVVRAIRQAMEAVHAAGAPRVHLSIKLGSRIDKKQSMADKVRALKK